MHTFSAIIELLQGYSEDPILNPPASLAEIAEAECIVGQRLPDDVRAAYTLGNGEAELIGGVEYRREAAVFSDFVFHSTQQIIDSFLFYAKLLDDGDLGDNNYEDVFVFPLRL